MGGGLESRCVGRVYGADGAVQSQTCRISFSQLLTRGVYVSAYDCRKQPVVRKQWALSSLQL